MGTRFVLLNSVEISTKRFEIYLLNIKFLRERLLLRSSTSLLLNIYSIALYLVAVEYQLLTLKTNFPSFTRSRGK